MRTDDLIRTMVEDMHTPAPDLTRRLGLALALGFVVSAAAFAATLGPRDDIVAALSTLRFDLKLLQVVLLAAASACLALRLARPAASTGSARRALAAAVGLVLLAVAAELAVLPPAQWTSAAVGSNAAVCLTAIPALALPIMVAALLALRAGAPTRPALAGAVAGLLAGSLSALLYAIHCTDDSPLFVALWYGTALAIVTLAGAAAGRLILRW